MSWGWKDLQASSQVACKYVSHRPTCSVEMDLSAHPDVLTGFTHLPILYTSAEAAGESQSLFTEGYSGFCLFFLFFFFF